MDEVRWLDEDEQRSWRGFVSGVSALMRRLEKEMLDAFDLSMDDYAILVLLSESPGRQLRMTQIGALALIPKPQVTYRVGRLERLGIVARRPCEDDARGTLATLTDEGFKLLAAAARLHVTNVRELVLDQMPPEDFATVGRAMARVLRAVADDECAEALRA